MGRIDMHAVASAAGVSQSTVSRVLHRPRLVRPETRKLVYEAIERLGYEYNSVAADFNKQRSSIIGLIIFTARSSIHADVIDGIQEELQNTKYSLIIGNSRYNAATERELIRLFRQRRLSGVIVAETTDENRDELRNLERAGVPTVVTWEMTEDNNCHCIGIDNYKASYEMTQYLVTLGHRRIAFIGGRYDRIERVRHRYQGFCDALRDHGVTLDTGLVVGTTPSVTDGREAMYRILEDNEVPSAVFAASDALAIGVISSLKDSGYSVPEDVSVCGFDDIDMAPFTTPPLTTVHVPGYKMGKLAAASAMRLGESTDAGAIRVCLPTSIVERGSCRAVNPSGG